tara:strand:- start:249 stop:842 length:594 start_codon:yes stop_codon:yes gene_type:complete
MKLGLIVLLFSFSVFGQFEGTLQLDSPIDYKRFFCEKTALPGDYLIKISKKSRSLKLKFKDIDGKRHSIKVKIPRHALPDHGGFVELTPGQTGQEFGIQANLETRVVRSEERSGREACSLRVRVRRCRRDEHGRNRCRTTYEDRPGQRFIRFIVTTHEKNLSLKLVDLQDLDIGQSSTKRVSTTRQNTYIGVCQPRP